MSAVSFFSQLASNNPFLQAQVNANAERNEEMEQGEWDYSGSDNNYAAGAPAPLLAAVMAFTGFSFIQENGNHQTDFLEDADGNGESDVEYFPLGW